MLGDILAADVLDPAMLETLEKHGPVITSITAGSEDLRQLVGQRMKDVMPALAEQGWACVNNSSYNAPGSLVSTQKWEFERSR